MLQLLTLFLGFVSWGMLGCCILFHKKYDRQKKYRFQTVSLMLCSIALYIPYFSQELEFRAKDYDSLIDCVSSYNLLALVLLGVNLFLNVVIFLQGRKDYSISDMGTKDGE